MTGLKLLQIYSPVGYSINVNLMELFVINIVARHHRNYRFKILLLSLTLVLHLPEVPFSQLIEASITNFGGGI
jgi:hypothetical protein